MPRPPTPVGTWGTIHTTQVSGVWEAHARFRMANGTSKQVRRRGASKTKAINNLKARLKALADEVTSGQITPDTRFAVICDLAMDAFERAYRLADKSPTTVRMYRGYVKNWIKPDLGELQAREVRAWGCNQLLQRAQAKSYSTANGVRAALLLCCTYAVRYGAMDVNPVKSTDRLARGEKKKVRAMTREQRVEFRSRLVELAEQKRGDPGMRRQAMPLKIWQDLPDIYDSMLATGARIGEILALDGGELDPAAAPLPTVFLGHHLVRETGVGLRRMAYRKSGKDAILLAAPEWSRPMWRRRKLTSGGGPVFSSWNGGWQDPNNVEKVLRQALDECGFEWVTSHVWRKTVATVLDEADLPTTAIADQLGNTPGIVEEHYRARRVANRQTAEALEWIFEEKGSGE